MARIICWRSGEVEVVSRETPGAITLMKGPRARLERILCPLARHAYDGKTLLVPGIPEAVDDEAAEAAMNVFQDRLEQNTIQGRRQ